MSNILEHVFVRKRGGGRFVEFDISKIENAVYKAACDSKVDNKRELAKKVASHFPIPSAGICDIEHIQDEVERILMKESPEVARNYILYREKKKELRTSIANILNVPVIDEISKKNLTVNSAGVFAARYLIRDLKTNQIKETMPQLWDRIAKHIAIVDVMYADHIFEKNMVYNQKSIDFDSLLEIYRSYKEDEKNPRLNEIYLEHVYRRFSQMKNNIALTFDEFFFIMFTNLETETVKNDVTALGYNIHDLFDAQDVLLPLFETRVHVYKELMSSFRFLPNTPTLMNAGTRNGQLCACFTLDMGDSIPEIFKTISDTAIIFQGAGGVGINFSKIRPVGDSVDNVPNAATGPISFQSIINFTTDIIKQGGKRKGANMGILDINHPQIEEWVQMKMVPGVMENYNISVGIDKYFWMSYDSNTNYQLYHPHNNVSKNIHSHQLFDMIADSAWKCAEPGVIYFDNINEYNPLKSILGDIRITNPCAEQAMYPNNSCTLGSINLAKYVVDGHFDYDGFREAVYTSTQFLDNVLDINRYPTPEIEQESIRIRRIGLGYMGLAHALYKMNIPYNSKEGFDFIEKISSLLTFHSMEQSVRLAVKRGAHGYWNELRKERDVFEVSFDGYTENSLTDFFDDKELVEFEQLLQKHGIRNTWTTTIAPTGTISMAADTSSAIEPVYSLVYVKNTSVGRFYYIDKEFARVLKEEGIYSDELLEKVVNNHGSCRGLDEIPKHIQNVFVTSVDIHWLDHLYALAKGQKGISNSISKTVNLPKYVTPNDFKLAYLLSRYMGIKGLALYRDGSRNAQVLDNSSVKDVKENEHKNPFNKHLTEIGKKAVEKTAVIKTAPSYESIACVIERILPYMNNNIGKFVLEALEEGEIIEVTSPQVNTDLLCVVCGAGMIKDAHCTHCSVCEYGYCA